MRYHYDVGNDFCALFLDESMTYSCAIFSRGASTLEEAQQVKLEVIATKLGLQPGMKVLDVGRGWGSFAIHAARNHGVSATGVTLSPPQAELARRRVADAGLADKVEIRVADYRDLPGKSFDAIASIGMSEHVGAKQIDVYARSLHAPLAPGGTLLNHAIASLDPDHRPLEDVFSTRYVLRHWSERLDEAGRIAGEARTRAWRLYLRAARHGFERPTSPSTSSARAGGCNHA